MTAPLPPSPSTPTQRLNATPLSQHVLSLMQRRKATPPPGLILLGLVLWAKESLPLSPEWAERLHGLAARVEQTDPEALYETLAEAEAAMLDAPTLEAVAMAMLRPLADRLPA